MKGRLSPFASVLRHLALWTTSAFVLLPFVWMLSTSLKGAGDVFRSPSLGSFIPQDWNAVANYARVFEASPMVLYLLNGVIVCFGILALQLVIALPCAYAVAKLRFRGRDILFTGVVAAILIPGQILALPLFVMFYGLGLLDSYASLILPHIISVFGIFLFRQFFKAISDDYIYAARLDGMSEFGIVWRVMTPIAAPAIFAFSAFSISSHWNDLLWPMIMIQDPDLATPPLGLLFFKSADRGNDYGGLMAAATVVAAPLILGFFWAQRGFAGTLRLTGEPR